MTVSKPAYIQIINPKETRAFLNSLYLAFANVNKRRSMQRIKDMIDQLDEHLSDWRTIPGFEAYEMSIDKLVRNAKTKKHMRIYLNNDELPTISLRRNNTSHTRSVNALYRATFPELGLKQTRKPRRKTDE